MRGPSPLLALALALLARPAAAVGDGSPYPLTSLLLVRVGDGFGSTLTARAAPVYLDEVYPAFAASQGRVSSRLVEGATLPANDWSVGGAQLSGDGAFATFGAVAAPVNVTSPVPCTLPGSCFPGIARVLVRVSWDGSVSTATTLDPASWSGLVKGACAADGAGYFVVGNSSTVALGWKAHGTSTVAQPLVNQYAAAAAGSAMVACAVGPTTKSLYLVRSGVSYGYIDKAAVAVPGAASVAVTVNTFFASSPFSAKQVAMNRAETRFFVAVAGTSASDGGIYTGAAVTGMALSVATTYKVTGLALSRDEATLYFTTRASATSPAPANARDALYSVSAACVASCIPTLLYRADAGTQLRGLFIAPAAAAPSASPTVGTVPSATPTGSSPPSSSSLPAASPLASSAPQTPAFAISSLLVVRVGDGAAPLTSSTAPIFIDEVDGSLVPATPPTAAVPPKSTRAVTSTDSVSVSGTDYGQGTLQRSVDGANVAFAAIRAPAGTTAQATTPWVAGDRVVLRLSIGGAITSTTTVSSTLYDGVIRSVCSASASGFFVVGNASAASNPNLGVGYVPEGSANTMNALVSTAGGDFSACALGKSGTLYLARSTTTTGFFFLSFANMPTSGAPLSKNPAGTFAKGLLAKQLIVNAAETKVFLAVLWANLLTDPGIFSAPAPALTPITPLVPNAYRVTGIALSWDESTLFFTTRLPTNGVYSILASCTGPAGLQPCAPVLLFLAPANTEYRGIALAPFLPSMMPSTSPSATPSPTSTSRTCPVGSGFVRNLCVLCVAGSTNPSGSASCTCTDPNAAWSSATNTCGCNAPLSNLGVAGGPCTACSTSCPSGSYLSGPCTAVTDIACSLCATCEAGSFRSSTCTATANTVCTPCPAGQFSYGANGQDALSCTPCGAGSAPAVSGGSCVCADPNAVWSRATNACSCAYGYTGAPCAVDPTAVTQTSTPSTTPTATTTSTLSPTPTPSVTPTASMSQGASLSSSITPPASSTVSLTSSNSRTPSVSPTSGASLSAAASASSGPPPTPTATASPASRSPTPSPTPSTGSALGGAIPSGTSDGGGVSPTSLGGIVVGAIVVTAAIAYFVQKRKERQGGGGGLSGRGGGSEWAQAPAVVVNPNPLQRGQAVSWSANSAASGGRRERAAFTPQVAEGGAGGGGFVPGFDQWTQCTEVATGKTWYFCEATGVTVWVLPPGHRIVKQLVQ